MANHRHAHARTYVQARSLSARPLHHGWYEFVRMPKRTRITRTHHVHARRREGRTAKPIQTCQLKLSMAWRAASRPFFHPGCHVKAVQRQHNKPLVQWLAFLVSKLQLNGLLPDEATDRKGNCGRRFRSESHEPDEEWRCRGRGGGECQEQKISEQQC